MILTLGLEFKCKEFKECVKILFISLFFWLFVLLCLALFSNGVDMGGNWPLAPPSFCLATSHQCLPSAVASQKPAAPGACGAHSPVIWSTAGGGRGKDLRTGTPCLVVCPQALCSAWVTYPLWSGGMGDDLVDRISWSGEWTVTPSTGGWQHPLHRLTKYKCLLGRQPTTFRLISHFTLNKPIRSLPEQGLMGWVRKARTYLLPWELRSKDRDCRSGRVTYLKKISGKENWDDCRTGFCDLIWGQLLWFWFILCDNSAL